METLPVAAIVNTFTSVVTIPLVKSNAVKVTLWPKLTPEALLILTVGGIADNSAPVLVV